jgi:hypothetical protein
MNLVARLHSRDTFQIRLDRLVGECEFFQRPALFAVPCTLRSSAPVAVFTDFVTALNTETFALANENVGGL